MATFLKGESDQFGPIQLYRPDYQFLTQVYGTKQAEYDRGFNAVKSLYSSVLNSGITNSQNETFRTEAFKKLQSALRSVTNTDLSNPGNILRAQSLISPISQDEDLAYDMAVTRFHQKQKQMMENYKNSSDPKMRAMYNEYSKMDIAFAEEDLRNAKRGDGSIRAVQPREFTPFEDVMEYLRTAAAKDKLEIKQAGPDGKGYIITRTNGEAAVPIFTDWAKATMGNRFDRQFAVMGRVQAESAIRTEMQNSGISRQEAIQKLSTQLLPVVNERKATEGSQADKDLTRIEGDIKVFENNYPNGFPPNKPQVKEEYERLIREREAHKNKLDGARTEVSKMQEEGPQYVASNLYNLFTDEAKNQTALAFGATTATAHQSVDVRPDSTWATKANIASREKMQSRQLAWDREKTMMTLDQKERHHQDQMELKIAGMKADGKLPSEQFVGTGVSQGTGADVLSEAFSENRGKAHQAAFNAENGLMKLVLSGDERRYGEVYGVISKLQRMAAGAKVDLSDREMQTLRNYAKDINLVNVKEPGTRAQANGLLDIIAGNTYTVASQRLRTYSNAQKTGVSAKYLQSFEQAALSFNNLSKERDNLYENMQRITKEVMNADGTIKEAYKGAVIRGRLGNGVFDIDLSGVSPAAKRALKPIIADEFNARANTTNYKYQFSRLSAAELDALVKNPYGPSKITTSDGANIDLSKLRDMNYSDLSKLFGDQATAYYDSKKREVRFELNVSQNGDLAKKLGIKGTQSVYLSVPYSTIQSSNGALSRAEKYIGANEPENASMAVLEDFVSNPFARVVAPSYVANSGFDYAVTGTRGADGRNILHFNYTFVDPATGRKVNQSKYLDYTPGDMGSLKRASEYINNIQQTYINERARYEDNND